MARGHIPKLTRLSGEYLESRSMMTTDVTTTLLADFSPGESSSEFSNFVFTDDAFYFNVGETELWTSDGTAEGTRRLGSVELTGNTRTAEMLGVRLFTVKSDWSHAIWRTDGTSTGTYELFRLPRFSDSIRLQVLELDGFAYVSTRTRFYMSLYRTDGTAEGTELISSDLTGAPVETPNGILFAANNQLDESWIFQTSVINAEPQAVVQLDGSVYRFAGTHRVRDGMVFFVQGEDELIRPWITDGTQQGTVQLSEDGLSEPQVGVGTMVNDVYVYPANQRGGIFRTDGTREGTYHVGGGFDLWLSLLGETGSDGTELAYFLGCECDDRTNVYSTDGSHVVDSYYTSWGWAAMNAEEQVIINDSGDSSREPNHIAILDSDGIREVAPSNVGPNGADYGNVGDTWYYNTWSASPGWAEAGLIDLLDPVRNVELPKLPGAMRTNGKLNSEPLFLFGESLTVLDGGLFPKELASLSAPNRISRLASQYADDAFYFTNSSEAGGLEVWVSDATPEGTQQIDLFPGPDSSDPTLMIWNRQVFAIATHPEFGQELWTFRTVTTPDPIQLEVRDAVTVLGESVELHADVMGRDRLDDLTVSWDLDNDGEFDDAVGLRVTLEPDDLAAFDPPLDAGLHPITARVMDPTIGQSYQDVAGLLIQEATLRFEFGSETVLPGNELAVRVVKNGQIDDDARISISYRTPAGGRESSTGPELVIPGRNVEAGVYSFSASSLLGGSLLRVQANGTFVVGRLITRTENEVSLRAKSDLDTSRFRLQALGFSNPVTYSWDIDGNGVFDDAEGVAPRIPWEAIADKTPERSRRNIEDHSISVQVRDSVTRETVTRSLAFTVQYREPKILLPELPDQVERRLEFSVETEFARDPRLRVEYKNEETLERWTSEAQASHQFTLDFPKPGSYRITVSLFEATNLGASQTSTNFDLLVELPGDTNGDFQVDFADFLVLSTNFGASNANRESGDFNADGVVGFADFLLLAHNFEVL